MGEDGAALASALPLTEDSGLAEAAPTGLAARGFVGGEALGDGDVEDVGVSVPGEDDAVLDPPVFPLDAWLLPSLLLVGAVAVPFKGFSGGWTALS